jgi:bifunctional enzyme CysN/CysC
MPVQWVNRPGPDFRGFSGLVTAGSVRPGDEIVSSRGLYARVERIVTFDGDLPEASAGASVTLLLDREIDISRGDVLADPNHPPEIADQLQADLVWTTEEPLLPGRSYLMKIAASLVPATVTDIRHKIDPGSLEPHPGKTLALNEIGSCNLALDHPVSFDPYLDHRDTGGFILIDRMTNATAGLGLVRFALRRAHNITWQALDVNKAARAAMKRQKGCVIWFTGLSGAGKSTLANLVEKRLHAEGRHTYLLDGDNLRHGLNRDLGFTEADRVENIRRVREVARLMVDAGLIVLVSLISPFRADRQAVRRSLEPGEFIEVFVDAPLSVAEERDPKGLYAKARRGEIANFTGVDSPYEPPEEPELRVDTSSSSPEKSAEQVLAALAQMRP